MPLLTHGHGPLRGARPTAAALPLAVFFYLFNIFIMTHVGDGGKGEGGEGMETPPLSKPKLRLSMACLRLHGPTR